jgi:MFS family permease
VTTTDPVQPRPDQVGGAEPLAAGATPPVIPTSMHEVREFIDADRSASGREDFDGDASYELDAYVGRGNKVIDLAKRAPFGWWPVTVLALVAIIDRMEQSVLAGALEDIQESFGIGDAAAGAIATATGLAAFLLVIPAGFIADRVNRTKAIAFILALWSMLSLGTGLAATFAILFAFRVVLGAASVLNNPMAGSLIGDFYPRAARGKAYGIERLFYFLGNPVGIIMGGVIAQLFGWRWVFLGLVIPGLVIAVLAFFLGEPKRGTADRIDLERERRGLTPRAAEKAGGEREADDVDLLSSNVWRDMVGLLKQRTLRLVIISSALLYLGLGGLFFWTPSFYQRAFGLESGPAAGIVGGIGLLGIIVGFFIGLRLGDRYVETRPGWRLTLGSIGISLGVLGLAGLALSPVLGIAAFAFFLVNVGFFLSVPAFTASLADLSGASKRGLTFALSTLVISLASSIAPGLIGVVSEAVDNAGLASRSDSLRYSFALLVVPVVAGVFVALKGRSSYDADADEARRTDPAMAA